MGRSVEGIPESFYEAAVSELVAHGLPIRNVNLIEQHYGLFVKGLVGVTPEQMLRHVQFGYTALKQLQAAMKSLLQEKLDAEDPQKLLLRSKRNSDLQW